MRAEEAAQALQGSDVGSGDDRSRCGESEGDSSDEEGGDGDHLHVHSNPFAMLGDSMW